MRLFKSRTWIIVVFSFLLLAAVPFLQGPGLTNVYPVGNYLNGNFPSLSPSSLPYKPAFPNLTFNSPLTFNMHPTQNIIILGQRDGKIYWFNNQDQTTDKNLMLDLSNEVGVVWDGGFLGLALHPDFGTAGSNYFYTYYTTKDSNGNNFPNSYTTQNCNTEEYWGNYLMLTRFEVADGTLNVIPNSQTTLFKVRMYGTTHRGGGLLFGDDGFLYLATGDQTEWPKSQDIINNIDGGVLRMDVDKIGGAISRPANKQMPEDHGFSDEITGKEYYIPYDNPFINSTANDLIFPGYKFEEYYTLGHRNPHRMTKDTETGILYIGEIGLSTHEEINVVSKGKNFGWPVYEGNVKKNFCGNTLYNSMAHEGPLVSFPRSDANSIIGGFVYRGTEVPELYGKYICADYGTGEEIWSVDVSTGNYDELGTFLPTNVISFGQDDAGEIYIMKLGTDTLYKLAQKNDVTETIPEWLSQTGAFTNLSTLAPTPGVIEYDLIEPFWSDRATKKRWLAIPNNGTYNTPQEQIEFSENDVWNFPVGSVLIKHFELPLDANNPGITKRLETRFSIKGEDGKFYFATYKWNPGQTDAQLLDSGLDETINITDENGQGQQQIWHYPSTAECLSCHNSASGGTLGARTRYINKNITYQETAINANQLVTLSSLGILDETITDAQTTSYLTAVEYDSGASLDEKARSYLDLNCAYCHSPGTGNRAGFDLRLINTLEETGLLTAGFSTDLGISGAAIVVEGDASKSLLYHRLNSADPNIMMPPLSKNEVDTEAATMIETWINQLGQSADLTLNYTLQGRTDHSIQLIVDLYEQGSGTPILQFTPNGSASGVANINNIPPGTYVLAVKTNNHSQRVQTITLADGINSETIAELNAGDANNDNLISALDFSILAATFNLPSTDPGFDVRADFNGDGFITALDFSLLASNFNTSGENIP